jgi:hypothetical protein
MELVIGTSNEGIAISLRDAYDTEGWIDAEISVRLGVWRGRYAAQFRGTDIALFAEGLATLERTLSGQAVLESSDGYLDVILTGDGRGHVAVSGEAWDQPRFGSHLAFTYEVDQTFLAPLLAGVGSVIDRLGVPELP